MCFSRNIGHSHGGSQEDFRALSWIDTRAWETSSNHSSEGSLCSPFLSPSHGHYPTIVAHEYPTPDTPWNSSPSGSLCSLPVSGGSFTTPNPISPIDFFSSSMVLRDEPLWHQQLPPHSLHVDRSHPAGNPTHEPTQSDWTAMPVNVHALHTQFVPDLPSPSASPQLPMSIPLGRQDLLGEDQIPAEANVVQEYEMYCCPLLTSGGARCDALIPREEAPLMVHFRGIHALRAKCMDSIPCPWPECNTQRQTASTPRHIITSHIKICVWCSYCGKSLTRKDGKMKHEKICRAKP
jgi:hypothetical protein